MQESALLHSFLLLCNFYFLQWLLTLEKWKEGWLELVWRGFLGSLAPLVALISLDWSWLSSWAVIPSLTKMLMLTTALTPFRDSTVICSLAYAAHSETVFMSRVDSHGNSNAVNHSHVGKWRAPGAVWWLIPSTCACQWGGAWFRRAYNSLCFWIMQPMKQHFLQQSGQRKFYQCYFSQIQTKDTVQGAALLPLVYRSGGSNALEAPHGVFPLASLGTWQQKFFSSHLIFIVKVFSDFISATI